MFLYNLSLQAPTTISAAILGHFMGTKQQEVVVARQQRLELWKADTNTGKLSVIYSEDLFCRIRSIAPFRLTGSTKDYVVLGSDTGAAAVLEFDAKEGRFKTLQYHEYGRTGLRRIIPGQYVASDPRGRAVMVGSVERARLVYIISRDTEGNVMMGSPLEANKAQSICFDIVGVDVGYENPVFATIETNYGDTDHDPDAEAEKLLVYYELDLGLNHVVRKWSTPISKTANRLIALPGSSDGPSGVLVCSEGFIEYKHNLEAAQEHRVPIPRRVNPLEDTGRGLMIVASAVHRTKTAFFILAQSEDGDLYKITVDFAEDTVERLTIKYFDTIPRCASIGILRAGFLFAASESGSHQLYQFENLGDEVDMVEYTSTEENDELVYFQPHEMASLAMVDEIDSLCPMLKSKVLNLTGEQMPQIYSLCGQGARSSLKVVRHGLEVAELAVSELPGNPQAVWTVRRNINDEHDEYIVVSFLDATLVLSVGEEVDEVTDSGFLTSSPTLCLHRLDGGALLQVTPRAVRHILPDGRVNEWQPPQNREISSSAANSRQVVVTLARSGGQAIYFELDLQTGTLREYDERLAIGSDATCLALSPVAEGQRNASFLAVGCEDDTVRIFSLDPQRCLEPLSMQAVAECAQSVAIVSQMETLTLYVGLRNGLQMRASIDDVSGEIEDSRMQFLGSQAVQLCTIKVRGEDAVVALSTAPWISHVHQGRLRTTPLSYDALTYASSFSSDQCPEGIVAVVENTLRILTLDRLDSVLNQATIGLT
ncbi:pre-mRNA-splicing factor rse1, partial [Linderina pennispora]